MSDPAETFALLLSEKSSGSTAFLRELCKHPRMGTAPETNHYNNELLYWLKAAVLEGRPDAEFLEDEPRYDREEARELLEALVRANDPDLPTELPPRELIRRGWRRLSKGHHVFLDKSPQYLQNWGAFETIAEHEEAFEASWRFVALVRNPLDMLYSAWRRWGSDPRTRQRHWLAAHRNLLRLKRARPEDVLVVRYEDLVTSEETIREVTEFLGEKHQPPVGSGFHSGSLRRFADDPSFGFQPDPEVVEVASEFGYDEESLRNPNRIPQALWRSYAKLRATYRRLRERLPPVPRR